MHFPSHVTDLLGGAFDHPTKEWWETFASPTSALGVLGRLWNCSDFVGSDVRDAAADWLLAVGGVDEEYVERLRQGCSFSQLAQALRTALRNHLRMEAVPKGGGEAAEDMA